MAKEKTHKPGIAAFDFDGTLINRDSLPCFLLYTFGWGCFLIRLPWIIVLRIASVVGLLSVHKAKEKIISSFVRGMRQEDFRAACRRFATRIPGWVYPEALQEIQKHREAGNEILIISASVPEWIYPWAETIGISIVEGTELECRNGRLTGRFATPNCKGQEKVRRLRTRFPDYADRTLYVYGDSPGDHELLALANHPHYKPFRKPHQT